MLIRHLLACVCAAVWPATWLAVWLAACRCWYVGLWPAGGGGGGEVSAAVLQRDQYAVYWGDYSVKRFL